MKRISVAAASGITTLVTLGLISGTAFAWTYGLTGNGQCQTDGSFKITWTVDNSVENEPLTITSSSNTAVVSNGTIVPSKTSENFSQVADGTKAGSDTLTLEGNFPSDPTLLTRTATVTLKDACTQPVVVPPTTTTPAPTAAPVVTKAPAAAKTPAPVGSVNAGSGDAKSLDAVAAVGLVGSAALIIVGARRLSKS